MEKNTEKTLLDTAFEWFSMIENISAIAFSFFLSVVALINVFRGNVFSDDKVVTFWELLDSLFNFNIKNWQRKTSLIVIIISLIGNVAIKSLAFIKNFIIGVDLVSRTEVKVNNKKDNKSF